MSEEPVLLLDGVSKLYRIYRRRHESLKEFLINRSLGQWQELWALRDVSFEVRRGQAVGVIGHNGSGKSTLLKVLSGIVLPDAGRVEVGGRVTSLLELGAGFHQEYTGRENIYLYGALMGLRRREVEQAFDAIVEFSELGDRIEDPIKHYSSGQYARLGFSVAVHLKPDILLIDEVLAVGDQSFQQKCFEHLRGLRRQGCTIILVSHDLESIKLFCDRALWLDQGSLLADGTTDNAIATYLELSAERASERRSSPVMTTDEIKITSVRYRAGGQYTTEVQSGAPLTIEIGYEAEVDIPDLALNVTVFRSDGVRCFDTPLHADKSGVGLEKGSGVATLTVPSMSLHSGLYDITVAFFSLSRWQMLAYHDRLYPFTVRDERDMGGVAWLDYRWEVRGRSGVQTYEPGAGPGEPPRMASAGSG